MKTYGWMIGAVALAALGCGDDGATSESASGTQTASTPSTTATIDPSEGPATNTEGTTAGTATDTASTTASTTPTTTTSDPGTSSSTSSTSDPSGSSSTGIEPFCGDGNVDPGEECDDGDFIDDNSCSNECVPVPCEEQGGGFGETLSYIWISNSSQNTVSKINTKTAIEEARYYVEGGSPSRTSVNLFGDVAVSSRNPGGVTKIAAKIDDCVDANNDGMITTSTGPNDILPWGQDECVVWSFPVVSPGYSYGPRATAWVAGKPDPITCQYPTPVLWMGWKDQANTAHFMKIDGDTGDIIDEVTYPWGASYSPYGGAVDADGNFYATGLSTMPSIKIDYETMEITNLGNPPNNGCKYGMTLDLNGDIWVGSCGGNAVYHWDHETNVWTTLANAGGSRVNGIMADANGNVWGAGSSGCRLVHIDVESKTYVNNNIPLPGCSNPWGVSIDYEGFVWVVDMSASKAFKVDPETYQIAAEVTGLVGPYTYSDMTGVALKNQLIPE